MDKHLAPLDWTLVQAFLETAETGTLSAAALKLGLSQPTLGRQVKAAEQALGVTLFNRQARGLALTDAGTALLEPARVMRTAAAQLALAAAGRSASLAGVVRITASAIVSQYVLPLMLAHIRIVEPQIQLELVPSDTTENLLFREADIAVRMYRPEQLDVITRMVAELPTGLFAAKSYVARKGLPETAESIFEHDFVGYDRSDYIIRGFKSVGWKVAREFFPVRCDNQIVYWQLVRAGCGIGGAQLQIGLNDPGLVRVLPQLELPTLPVWLTAHAALRTNARIRRVHDLLAEGFATHFG